MAGGGVTWGEGCPGVRCDLGGAQQVWRGDLVAVLRIRIRELGSCAFLTSGSGIQYPGSGMGKKSGSGSGIRNEQQGSYFLEL